MRNIERLVEKARKYMGRGVGSRLCIICRNYGKPGEEWLCRITKIVHGQTVYDEQYFPTKETAAEYGQREQGEDGILLIDDI